MSYTPLAVRAHILDEVHANAGVSSSVAEQTLASLAIPAALVAAGDLVRFRAAGQYLNSSGGAVTFTTRFKLGATTVLATGAISLASSVNPYHFKVDCDILIESPTAQRAGGLLGVSSGATADNWGPYNGGFSAVGHNNAAEDLTVAKNVILTVQLGTSNASAVPTLTEAALELIKKT